MKNSTVMTCRRCLKLALFAAFCSIVFFPAVHADWTSKGPSPITNGQNEGILNKPVSGAVHGVAPHPSNANILYIASINGGIWKTTNATAASPTWTAQTDDFYTLSASDIIFDPADNTFETLVAGFGRFSSLGSTGGGRGGLLRTTDGGANWTELASATMRGKNITKVTANGSLIMAGVDFADGAFDCNAVNNLLGLYRSLNSGTSFSKVAGGLPPGQVLALEADPANAGVYYTAVFNFNNVCAGGGVSGIYKSTDSGANWSKVSDATIDALFPANTSVGTLAEISVSPAGAVFVAVTPNTTGQLGGVFRSSNGGTSWNQMDLPTTSESGSSGTGDVGIHPGGQGGLHMSLVADPSNSNIVYIGGDRQPVGFLDSGSFPNSIGAVNFSGRLFRGDASQTSGSQWTPLTHNGTAGNSSPHADSRDMAFDANGTIIEGDDGGVFRRASPTSSSGDWTSVNGSLQVTEHHSMAHDVNSTIIIVGNQDNGTTRQDSFGSTTWTNVGSGDGGDVAIDEIALAGSSQTIRYHSAQLLQSFVRRTYNAANSQISAAAPALSVTSGSPIQPGNRNSVQFVTPLATNQVAGGRLVIGATSAVYESLDFGNTLTQLTPSIPTNPYPGSNPFAYGGDGNAELLWVASNSGVYLRTTAGAALTNVRAGSHFGIANDVTDANQAVAITASTVVRTTNQGVGWSDITGNLASFTPGTFRSIVFIPSATDDAIVLGTDTGVFWTRASDGFTTWSEMAAGLPNVPVFDLRFDPVTDNMIAGTFGRGTFALTPVLNENQVDTTTALVSSPPNSVFGQSVTFTATVDGSAPTGTVGFFSDDVLISGCEAVNLVGGGDSPTAECMTSSLNGGQRLIQASYAGDSANLTSQSTVLNFIVTPLAQTITFPQPADQLLSDGALVVSATVASGLDVSLTSDTPSVCTASGATVFFATRGDCSIRASQAGNQNYGAAPDVVRTFAISEPTQTQITSVNPPTSGESLYTVSVDVTSVTPPLRNFEFLFQGALVPSTMDFELATANQAPPILENGLTLTTNADFTIIVISGTGGVVDNGSKYLAVCVTLCNATNPRVTITRDDDASFSLESVDVTNLVLTEIEPGQTVDVLGNLAAGGTVTQSFVLVADTFTTFNLNDNFKNLSSVEISSTIASCPGDFCDIAIDNIVVGAGGPRTDGNIMINEDLLPNPDGTGLSITPFDPLIVPGLNATVSGASAGNGSFNIGDLSGWLLWNNGLALDYTSELVGQPTNNDPWGTLGGTGGDFNLFGASPAPEGTNFFTLSANGGASDPMFLESMQSVSVTSPGTPTGSVLVSGDDGSSCVIAALVNGQGSCDITPIDGGFDFLTAQFTGTDFFLNSQGAATGPGAFDRLSPVEGAVGVSSTPIFTWQASVGATAYEFCADLVDDGLCQGDLWIPAGNATSIDEGFSVPPLTNVYWHVRAIQFPGLTYAGGSATGFGSFTTEGFNVGGTVSGLLPVTDGIELIIQNEGANDQVITANGGFSLPPQFNGTSYDVTIRTYPGNPNATCVVENPSGVVSGADVTNINVVCTDSCEIKTVAGVEVVSPLLHEACEFLTVGPEYNVQDGAAAQLNSGLEVWLLPGFLVEQGGSLGVGVCGQSLCSEGPDPMPDGCHTCVTAVCAQDPFCCGLEPNPDGNWDGFCLAAVEPVCNLSCEMPAPSTPSVPSRD